MTTGRFFATETEKRAWIALLLLAALLRVAALGARPFHHDESIHAWASNRLVTEGNYKYDPVYHGPVQYYMVGLAIRIHGLFANPRAMTPGEADAATRLPAALGGVALVALALLLRPRFGSGAALVAGGLLAVSPDLLYYSRFSEPRGDSSSSTPGSGANGFATSRSRACSSPSPSRRKRTSTSSAP